MTKAPGPINLPSDVINWLRHVFIQCNEKISNKITDIPTAHEESFDLSFIEAFSHLEAPVRLPSGWTLRFETHFLGGARHFHRWEIADIGLLLMIRTANNLRLSKIALLQSKRLYPDEITVEEEHTILDYQIGFRRLFEQDDEWAEFTKPRAFSFTQDSKYRALKVNDTQYKAIKNYEKAFKIPVYYLLYNPNILPWTTNFPLVASRPKPPSCNIGCRILPAKELQKALKTATADYTPMYRELSMLAPKTSLKYGGNWRLEDFAVDLFTGCEVGHITGTTIGEGLQRVFNERTGPLNAAISITMDAPEDYRFD